MYPRPNLPLSLKGKGPTPPLPHPMALFFWESCFEEKLQKEVTPIPPPGSMGGPTVPPPSTIVPVKPLCHGVKAGGTVPRPDSEYISTGNVPMSAAFFTPLKAPGIVVFCPTR